jgi:hypothetical protein
LGQRLGRIFWRRSRSVSNGREVHVKKFARVSALMLVVGSTGFVMTTLGNVAALAPRVSAEPAGCTLGNGVQHVINVIFDNVHFNGDKPNVLSGTKCE